MYIYFSAIFVGLLLLSNILSVKLFEMGSFILPSAAIVYVITYLMTDVIGEVYGKAAARKTVLAGFLTQIIAMVFIYISIQLPPAPDFHAQAEFEQILGGSFRLIFASLTSYVISQNLSVSIFHWFKHKHGKKKLWLRNNLATMSSQFIDTVLFITIAFLGIVPTNVLLGMIVSQYIWKCLVALLDTPFAYILVKWTRKYEGNSPDHVIKPS
ncbi:MULTISPECIES: queuosine precursor transporter [Oceanobacillus]|uniref:Probable queuosine precursor transporter n=1 Tax=Oceanobacillus kimchii TaxID=746691 RepID=A0ABQ5TMR1_9BACI|nr:MULTISPECIES: queuosine precursor transporter [Oceanobacillus]MBT2600792.1 queuosine precursor transporter [Oceanobacillus sp. ISL-74]MBT2650811.1 queuosine precursor transporter [Oceanobacillus sp. ISL-73]MCT1575547.1 queuosine precursor transporter [Oceanobacillus kimchii]MCT2137178.1 queuosine precursor transporter [Oceanobacillus kimchii]OEH55363.1 transporter [Oceanobacillus sp. E9]